MQIKYDEVDRGILGLYTWGVSQVGNTHYAVTYIKRKPLLMHRLIMLPPKGMVVHHIDGNGLNNRRYNLDVVTQSYNIAQQPARLNTSSQYKGVYYRKAGVKNWGAQIYHQGKNTPLGFFLTEEEAARAWDKAAIRLRGHNTYLNFGVQ